MQQFNGTLNGPLIVGRASPSGAGAGGNARDSVISGAAGEAPFDSVLKGTEPAALPPVAGEGPRSRTGSLLPPAGTALPAAGGEAGGLADGLVGYFDTGEDALALAADAGSFADSIVDPIPVLQPGGQPPGPALAPNGGPARRYMPGADVVITGRGKNALQPRPADGPVPQSALTGTPDPLTAATELERLLPLASLDRRSIPANRDAGTLPASAYGRETAVTRSLQTSTDMIGSAGSKVGQGLSDVPLPVVLPQGRGPNGPGPRLTAGALETDRLARASLPGTDRIAEGPGMNGDDRSTLAPGSLAGAEWSPGRRSAIAASERPVVPEGRQLAGLRTAADQTAANERFAATPMAAGDAPDTGMPAIETAAARSGSGSLPQSPAGVTFSPALAGTTPAGGAAAPTGQPPAGFTIDPSVLDPAWQNAVNERMLWMAGRNLQSAELRLNPAELGPVQVQLSVDEKAVSLTISAAHPLTREALESALPRLREMLSENGMDLAGANVSDGAVDTRSGGEFEAEGELQAESAEVTGPGSGEPDDAEAPVATPRSAKDSEVDLFA